jgi:hypothetical protein
MARPERFELPTLWFEARRSVIRLLRNGLSLISEDLTIYKISYSDVVPTKNSVLVDPIEFKPSPR